MSTCIESCVQDLCLSADNNVNISTCIESCVQDLCLPADNKVNWSTCIESCVQDLCLPADNKVNMSTCIESCVQDLSNIVCFVSALIETYLSDLLKEKMINCKYIIILFIVGAMIHGKGIIYK